MSRRACLLLILLIAVALRVWGIGFGLPHVVARPDETEIAGPAVGFLSGDLRPPFFEWPTLFVYEVAFLYVVYFAVTRHAAPYKTLAAFAESRRQSIAPFLYVSRFLSAFMGVMSVWWVFSLGRRIFGETTGLVAALFLAVCFLHVRDSHFGTTDVAMAALVVLTVLAIVTWRDRGTLPLAAWAGFAGGLASSTKYNGLGVCIPFGVAALQRLMSEAATESAVIAARRAVLAVIVFGIGLAVGFLGTSPYIVIDWNRFLTSIRGIQSHLLQGHGMLLGRGWFYYARVVLPQAVGWPMLAAATAGIIALFATRFRDAAVLFAFPIAYYILAGEGYTVFARYVIPVLPFLCMAAAWTVVKSVDLIARRMTPRTRYALVVVGALVIAAPTARKTLVLDRLLSADDNRAVVAHALRDAAGPDTIVYESGERYGYAPLFMDGRPFARMATYDGHGRFDPREPDWIALQRSPLVLYSAVPRSLEEHIAEQYELVKTFPTGGERPDRVYDQQDAFFLPLGPLDGITRPGPSFELYRRKERVTAR